jgi:hypothetical protein
LSEHCQQIVNKVSTNWRNYELIVNNLSARHMIYRTQSVNYLSCQQFVGKNVNKLSDIEIICQQFVRNIYNVWVTWVEIFKNVNKLAVSVNRLSENIELPTAYLLTICPQAP